jgi:hypothetical protein
LLFAPSLFINSALQTTLLSIRADGQVVIVKALTQEKMGDAVSPLESPARACRARACDSDGVAHRLMKVRRKSGLSLDGRCTGNIRFR